MSIEITDIRIRKMGRGSTKALASITLNGVFVVHGLRIVEGRQGLFVSMPQRRRSDDSYVDLVHPLTKGLRSHIQQAVLDVYERENGGLDEAEGFDPTQDDEDVPF